MWGKSMRSSMSSSRPIERIIEEIPYSMMLMLKFSSPQNLSGQETSTKSLYLDYCDIYCGN